MFVSRVSQLEQGAKEMVFNSAIRPELNRFASTTFDQVCQQISWRMGLNGQLPFEPRRTGGWWQANQELDLVVLGDTQMLLVECKWSSQPVGIDVLQDLEARATEVQREAGLEGVTFALCSHSGFTDQVRQQARERADLHLYDCRT